MKGSNQLTLRISIAFFFLISLNQKVLGQDPVKVAPKNVKVLFENNRVRVIEVHLKPGEKIPSHSHPANLIFSLSTSKGKYRTSDGEITVSDFKPNEVSWSEPIIHSSENVGTTEIHAIGVELKDPPKKKSKTR